MKAVKNTWKLHLAVMIVSLQQEGSGENRATCEIIMRSLQEMALALGGAGYVFSAQFIYMLQSLLALHSARSSAEANSSPFSPSSSSSSSRAPGELPDPLAVLNRSLRLVLCERFLQELADEQVVASSAASGSARTPVPSAPHSRQSAANVSIPAHTPTGAAGGSLAPQEMFDIELLCAFPPL